VVAYVEEPAVEEAPTIEEVATIEEAVAAWRSRPRLAAVGGSVEEPAKPGRGGARGGAGCKGGSGVEEPSTPGCSWTGAIGGRRRAGAGVG
jgi:hypothetical protein